MTNVLLILLDDIGNEQLQKYARGGNTALGYAYPSTPTINALSDGGTVQGVTYTGGVRFERAYVEQLCSPTRATLLTGRHPFRHGVGDIIRDDNDSLSTQAALPESEYTLAKLLKANGYATACFGKWHMGNSTVGGRLSPNRAGFDYYAGNLFNSQSNVFTVNGASVREGHYATDLTVQGEHRIELVYRPTSYVNNALRWINEQRGPWFCYLPFYAVHSVFWNDTAAPAVVNIPPASMYNTGLWNLANIPVATTDPEFLHALKAGIEAVDVEIGRLLAGIAALSNTLVVFATDNGTGSTLVAIEQHPTLGLYTAAHGKDTPYEPAICTPLIVSGPGVVAGPRTCSALVHAVDIYPTIAAMAGITMPSGITFDGVSLKPILDNTVPALVPHATVYSEWFAPTGVAPTATNPDNGRTGTEWSMQNGTYKLVQNSSGFPNFVPQPLELYIVGPTASYNPMEQNNLSPGGVAPTNPTHLANWNSLRAARTALVEP